MLRFSSLIFLGLVLGGCADDDVVCGSSDHLDDPTAGSCRAEFFCAEDTFEIRCSAGAGDLACDCIEQGVVRDSFVSLDFCDDTTDRWAAARAACGWVL